MVYNIAHQNSLHSPFHIKVRQAVFPRQLLDSLPRQNTLDVPAVDDPGIGPVMIDKFHGDVLVLDKLDGHLPCHGKSLLLIGG